MIVQCEKCGTQYNLDDTKVRPGETKVRCSRCQHVFTVPHPLTLDEGDIFGDTGQQAEDEFMKEWAKEFPSQPAEEPSQPVPPAPDQAQPPRAFVPPAAEEPLFGEETPTKEAPTEETPTEETPTEETPTEETPSAKEEIFPVSPISVREVPAKKGRKVSTTLLLAIIFVGLFFISFWYWTKKGASFPAFEYIYEKIYTLWKGKKHRSFSLSA